MYFMVKIVTGISCSFNARQFGHLQSSNNQVSFLLSHSLCKIKTSDFFFRRTPILGKHSKRITCGAWSKDNILALGSEDKTFSLSSEDGDSLRVIQLRDVPSDMCFAEIKTDERVPGENTVCSIDFYIFNLFVSFLFASSQHLDQYDNWQKDTLLISFA